MRSLCIALVGMGLVAGLWLGQGPFLRAQEAGPSPPPLPTPEGPAHVPAGPGRRAGRPHDEKVEVLTRGPLHEAYAMPVESSRTAGMIVAKQPPAPVEEVPPDVRPEGDTAIWIPGYWGWDQDRQDFLWVSGLWRSPPPGRQWMPGYWNQVPTGWQWVSGVWLAGQTETVNYFPEPPQSLEQRRAARNRPTIISGSAAIGAGAIIGFGRRATGRGLSPAGSGSRPLRLDPARLVVC